MLFTLPVEIFEMILVFSENEYLINDYYHILSITNIKKLASSENFQKRIYKKVSDKEEYMLALELSKKIPSIVNIDYIVLKSVLGKDTMIFDHSMKYRENVKDREYNRHYIKRLITKVYFYKRFELINIIIKYINKTLVNQILKDVKARLDV